MMIFLKNINKTYQDKSVLKNVSLEAYKGDIICVLGKTGQGKSTLFNIISNIEIADSGFTENKYKKGEIEFVFQEDTLLPWLNVKSNILLNLDLKSFSYDKEYYLEILNKLGLIEYENYFPYKLSGGTKRKISIARSLICKPKFLILDEPFNGIDFIVKSEIENLLKNLIENENIEVLLFSSHLLESSIEFATKLFVLKNNEGLEQLTIDENLKLSIIENHKSLKKMIVFE